MCLLVLAWEVHPVYRLIVAANRDEFHDRPTQAMSIWPSDDIIGGRDLRAGGTWLAMDRRRRFGIITNFRELQRPQPDAPSRGNLIPGYLRNQAAAGGYLEQLHTGANAYSGFNLLLADPDALWYGSNRASPFQRRLEPGIYGLSNELLDTPWPKLQRVRRRFDPLVAQSDLTSESLFEILADRTQAGVSDELPQTGLSEEWEQLLSSPFISNEDYGTRCSTIVLVELSGRALLIERRFDRAGHAVGETQISLAAHDWR